MSIYADIPDFTITRKPKVMLEPFECVICERAIQDEEWQARTKPFWNKPPICGSCAHHWGRVTRPSKITRGDLFALNRLKAVTERLNWEIYNGKFAKRSVTTWGALQP